MPCCPASCAICLPRGTPWGVFAQRQLQQRGPQSAAALPASGLVIWAFGRRLGLHFQGQPNRHDPSPLPKRGGSAPSPLSHEPCPLLWQFWHHWPLLRQFNFLKCQKDFFSFLAGIAFCRFSELCHPVKVSSHPQSWLGESGASSPAGGDQLLAAPVKAPFRHQRKLRDLIVFSFFFTEAEQQLICKISLWPSCTGADVHEKGLI